VSVQVVVAEPLQLAEHVAVKLGAVHCDVHWSDVSK
jgi:hypothetical protein